MARLQFEHEWSIEPNATLLCLLIDRSFACVYIPEAPGASKSAKSFGKKKAYFAQ